MTEELAPIEAVEVAETGSETPEGEVGSPKEDKTAADKPVGDQPISGKLGTLLRREQSFQQKVKAEKAKIVSEREALAAERADLEGLKARFARIKDDPIEGLKESGLNYEELTRKIIQAGTPEAKIEALHQKLEAIEAQRRQELQEQQSRVSRTEIESSKDFYQKHIFNNIERFPTVSLYDEQEVREAAWHIATQAFQKTGEPPDAEQVAEYMEEQAASRFKALEDRRAKRVPPVPASPVKGAKVGSKTLTNGKAAERSTPELPVDIDKLPLDEQKRIYADYLRKNLWIEK